MKNTITSLTIISHGQTRPTETMTEAEALDLMRDLGFSAYKTANQIGVRRVLYKNPKYPGTVCRITFQH